MLTREEETRRRRRQIARCLGVLKELAGASFQQVNEKAIGKNDDCLFRGSPEVASSIMVLETHHSMI